MAVVLSMAGAETWMIEEIEERGAEGRPPTQGADMTTPALRDELGERACRAMVMENSGRRSRRCWWIVSAEVLAVYDRTA